MIFQRLNLAVNIMKKMQEMGLNYKARAEKNFMIWFGRVDKRVVDWF